eukprot:3775277-Amphidinium_carterae.1
MSFPSQFGSQALMCASFVGTAFNISVIPCIFSQFLPLGATFRCVLSLLKLGSPRPLELPKAQNNYNR